MPSQRSDIYAHYLDSGIAYDCATHRLKQLVCLAKPHSEINQLQIRQFLRMLSSMIEQ